MLPEFKRFLGVSCFLYFISAAATRFTLKYVGTFSMEPFGCFHLERTRPSSQFVTIFWHHQPLRFGAWSFGLKLRDFQGDCVVLNRHVQNLHGFWWIFWGVLFLLIIHELHPYVNVFLRFLVSVLHVPISVISWMAVGI